MTIAEMIWLLCGLVLMVGGLVALLIVGHWMGLAPFLAGVVVVMAVDLRIKPKKQRR
jgi:CHASE2 domain-containing sensor protein